MDNIFLINQKQKLEREKEKLDKQIRESEKYPEMGTSSEDTSQEVDQFTDNMAADKDLVKERNRTDGALRRIQKGTYGQCQKCHQQIDVNRLTAYPAAEYCIKCSKK